MRPRPHKAPERPHVCCPQQHGDDQENTQYDDHVFPFAKSTLLFLLYHTSDIKSIVLHYTEMKIVLAQGNPGLQYAGTRHNIGWVLLEVFATAHNAVFKPEKKFAANIATTYINGEKVLLVKPTTFYNETGRTARALTDFYKLDPATDILVIHDDLSLPFGTIRIRQRGSDAGNNGIKSISSHLGPDYWRLRVGIWDEKRNLQPDTDFVLSRFSVDASSHIKQKIIPVATEMIATFLTGSMSATSHQTDTTTP